MTFRAQGGIFCHIVIKINLKAKLFLNNLKPKNKVFIHEPCFQDLHVKIGGEKVEY